MKRKVLQLLVIQDPKVKTYSKTSDFNGLYVIDPRIPESIRNYQEYDYLPEFSHHLQIGKLERIAFGFASNLVEKLTPSSMIISLGVCRYYRLAPQKLKVAEIPLELGTELPFGEVSASIRTKKLYLILYPHVNHLVGNDDKIQFSVPYLNNGEKQQKNFTMKYVPPTHIDKAVSLAVQYPTKHTRYGFEIELQDLGLSFSTQVLSEGFYISEQFVSSKLWYNIFYPQNAQGKCTVSKNWWESLTNLPSNNSRFPRNIVATSLKEDIEDISTVESRIAAFNITDRESPIRLNESITKVFHFCNLLSMKCGLEPYYKFVDTSIDGSGLPSYPSRPFPTDIVFNSSANGFRLPTGLELDLFFDQEKQKWPKIKEKIKENRNEHIDEHIAFCENMSTFYHLTHDVIPTKNSQGVLPEEGYIFELHQDDIMDSWDLKLDKKKLSTKIKELSNSKEFKSLRSRILIDPKMYPLDQGINYEYFVQSKFQAKMFDAPSPWDSKGGLDKMLQIRCLPYARYWSTPGGYSGSIEENRDCGFRIVKNKM